MKSRNNICWIQQSYIPYDKEPGTNSSDKVKQSDLIRVHVDTLADLCISTKTLTE